MTAKHDGAVVVFNVIGGLADMSLFGDVFSDGRTPAAWRAFFAHIPDAKVIEDHRDLVRAVADLGYTVMYSSTCPERTRADTGRWLATHDFPNSAALLLRADDETGHARRVKHQHCRAIPENKNRLRAFIDNEPHAVNYLRTRRLPAYTYDHLLELRISELRDQLAGITMPAAS